MRNAKSQKNVNKRVKTEKRDWPTGNSDIGNCRWKLKNNYYKYGKEKDGQNGWKD